VIRQPVTGSLFRIGEVRGIGGVGRGDGEAGGKGETKGETGQAGEFGVSCGRHAYSSHDFVSLATGCRPLIVWTLTEDALFLYGCSYMFDGFTSWPG
jgi:hypothetical protein